MKRMKSKYQSVMACIAYSLLVLGASSELQAKEKEILVSGQRLPICIRAESGIVHISSDPQIIEGTDATDKSLVQVFQNMGFHGARVCEKDENKDAERLEFTYSPVGIVTGGIPTYNQDGSSSGRIGGSQTIVWNVDLRYYTVDGKVSTLASSNAVCYTCLLSSAKQMARQMKKAAKQSNKHE